MISSHMASPHQIHVDGTTLQRLQRPHTPTPTPKHTPTPLPVAHTTSLSNDIRVAAQIREGHDAFDVLSTVFKPLDRDGQFWWRTTGKVFSQMMQRALYPLDVQYRYLAFFYTVILPELGPAPTFDLPLSLWSRTTRNNSSISPKSNNRCHRSTIAGSNIYNNNSSPSPSVIWPEHTGLPTPPSESGYSTPQYCQSMNQGAPSLPAVPSRFKSYMTDDHSPMELSWQFDETGGAVVRFAIDPVKRQQSSSAGAMGLFEDMVSLKSLAPGVDLEWCRICADMLTLPNNTPAIIPGKGKPEYPSQYFIGFDFSSAGIVLKAYFLPQNRSTLTSVSKTKLVTDCLTVLSTTTSPSSPPDLLTPWLKVASFFDSLPAKLQPDINIVAVDCVPYKKNRVKVYARTPRVSLANLRRFLTLGRDLASTSLATRRAYEKIKIMWHLLFPEYPTNDDDDDTEVPAVDPSHPTAGLLCYYELRGDHPDPFPKVYLPVRHLCRDDEQVTRAVETFYRLVGNDSIADRYSRDVRETFAHRPLSSRAGIHTYITFAAKRDDVEITSYFNPECYAPEHETSPEEATVAQILRVQSLQEQHDWEIVE